MKVIKKIKSFYEWYINFIRNHPFLAAWSAFVKGMIIGGLIVYWYCVAFNRQLLLNQGQEIRKRGVQMKKNTLVRQFIESKINNTDGISLGIKWECEAKARDKAIFKILNLPRVIFYNGKKFNRIPPQLNDIFTNFLSVF